jgi:hypothetical protein
MLRSLFVIALLAAIPLFIATPAANATGVDNIVLNQWYTAEFPCDVSCALQGSHIFGDGTDGPVLPSGFANSIDAPNGTTWTITLATLGTLTVTDLETSGDQFQMYDNGVLMVGAASPFTAPGQNPGWATPGNGYTSIPTAYIGYEGLDINAALGDTTFSSATFLLYSGTNVITGNYVGVVGDGDMAFIAEGNETPPIPEPSSLLLFGTGLLTAVGAIRRRLRA